MRKYEHIFFDLDHTLWDFSTNCAETLTELYAMHQLERFEINVADFIVHYRQINDSMWHDYHHGRIDKEEIRKSRFLHTFRLLGLTAQDVPPGLDDQFLHLCPTKPHVFPHTHEILDYLSQHYILHIITNGFQDTQHVKIKSAGLTHYFKEVIHADQSGFLKPDKRMFDYALNAANAAVHHSIMIGDDLFADVLGAKNYGMDHVFVNRLKQEHNEQLTYEIDCLSTLKTFL